MAITKPPVLPAWADAGDKVQPSDAEIQVGWPLSSVPPSRQRFNWLLNFLANGVRYFSRRGLPDYDAGETYMIGDRVIGDDGSTYVSIADDNTGNAPSSSPLKWMIWAMTLDQAGTLAQKGAALAATAGGTAEAITAAFTPAIAALVNGMTLCVRAGAANATTTPTFTPAAGTITPKAIVKGAGAALVAGDIAGAGHWIVLRYDQSLDKWALQNPATGVTAQAFASSAETQTGAATNKAVTPSGLAETMLGGVGQSWNDVTASRALSTTYTNSTGRPIFVSVSGSVNSAAEMSVLVNGVQVGKQTSPGGSVMCITAIVPPGATYRVQIGSGSLQTWFEMR